MLQGSARSISVWTASIQTRFEAITRIGKLDTRCSRVLMLPLQAVLSEFASMR